MPSVNQMYGELRDKGLEVALVSFRENPELVKRTVKERGYIAPVLLDESGDVTGRVYGVWAAPTIYLIDRQGRLIGRAVGPHDWESPAARRFIRALLDAGER